MEFIFFFQFIFDALLAHVPVGAKPDPSPTPR